MTPDHGFPGEIIEIAPPDHDTLQESKVTTRNVFTVSKDGKHLLKEGMPVQDLFSQVIPQKGPRIVRRRRGAPTHVLPLLGKPLKWSI